MRLNNTDCLCSSTFVLSCNSCFQASFFVYFVHANQGPLYKLDTIVGIEIVLSPFFHEGEEFFVIKKRCMTGKLHFLGGFSLFIHSLYVGQEYKCLSLLCAFLSWIKLGGLDGNKGFCLLLPFTLQNCQHGLAVQ